MCWQIFEQLPEEKASTSSLCSKCVIQQEQYPAVKGTLDHLSSKGTKISTPFNFGNGRPPLVPHGEPLSLIIYQLYFAIDPMLTYDVVSMCHSR